MEFRALSKNAPKTLRKGADFWIATQGVSLACIDRQKARLKFGKARNDKIFERRTKTSTAFLLALMAHFQTKSPKSPLNKAQNSNIKISKTSLKAHTLKASKTSLKAPKFKLQCFLTICATPFFYDFSHFYTFSQKSLIICKKFSLIL